MTFSLEGEDAIIRSLLRLRQRGKYYDIGCSAPIEFSNTYSFYLDGWSGLCVDGRDYLEPAWRQHRPKDSFRCDILGQESADVEYYSFPDPTMNTCDPLVASRYARRFPPSSVMVERRRVRNAQSVWMEYIESELMFDRAQSGGGAFCPDFVSIDVEGYELPIIRGLISPNFRPALLVVETKLFDFWKPLKNDIVRELCVNLGYVLIAKTPLDCFFIDPSNDLFQWLPKEMIQVYR